MNVTFVDIEPTDEGLLAAVEELGKANVLPPELACSDVPYLDVERLRVVATSNDHFVACYLDGELRAAVSFRRRDGLFGYVCIKRFSSEPGASQEGNAFFGQVVAEVRRRCGDVTVASPNPNTRTTHARFGMRQVER